MCEYKKSCADEIDFTMAEQMHAAALQISKTCFDLKKLCVIFLGTSMAILIRITDNSIDHSLFVVGLVLITGFLISDATAYFFQRRLRVKINDRLQNIEDRNKDSEEKPVTKVSEDSEEKPVPKVNFCGALFNGSMSLYFVLEILYIGGWIAYAFDLIGKSHENLP